MIKEPGRKALVLNTHAWTMSGESLNGEATTPALGLKLSKESLALIEEEIKSMSFRSKVFTKRQYLDRLKYAYAMYADTYALLAYKNGVPSEALQFQKIACENNKFSDAEMNERYAIYFEQINSSAETEQLIADFIAKGKATIKMRQQHKRLFRSNNDSTIAYQAYVSALEKTALNLLKEDLKAKMINTPAPAFDLLNLKGEKVNSKDLKGKVLVLDFWATWCKPCIASFPGMQKAVDKFAKSEDVLFLFIDTWESGDQVNEKVAKFISSNNYSFEVLMDTGNLAVNDYGVRGIPAKFVIDKEGMIRFKSNGSTGNADELVEELSFMIELAGGTVPKTNVVGAD